MKVRVGDRVRRWLFAPLGAMSVGTVTALATADAYVKWDSGEVGRYAIEGYLFPLSVVDVLATLA